MAAGSARASAVATVARVANDGIRLDVALERECAAAPADWSATIRSLSYGAIRGYFRYEAVLALLLSEPVDSVVGLPRALLSVALFELEDARSPEYAVVDAAVKTARLLGLSKLTGLFNAVLRRYLRERAAIDARIARNPIALHAFPEWLAADLRADWPVRWTQLLAASDRRAPMWLRINRLRIGEEEYLALLRAGGSEARRARGVPNAIELAEPCEVAELPGFDRGLVSVQDLGAQCVAFPLDLAPGLRVLDACAAPGGKTCLIAEQQPDLSALVGVEIDAERLQRLRANLQRSGAGAELFAADAANPAGWWDGKPFDRILLDVPCSALGVIRRHPDIRLRRKPGDFERFAATQASMLRAARSMLGAGGRIVYASCTLTRRENRDVVAAFLRDAPEMFAIAPRSWPRWPGFGEEDGLGVQILPGEAGADGFYYAALGKQ